MLGHVRPGLAQFVQVMAGYARFGKVMPV